MPKSKSEDLYELAFEHAKEYYGRIVDAADTLDKKADDLMRTAGAIGAALVATAKMFQASVQPMTRPILLAPAVAALVGAVLLSARARWPAPLKLPLNGSHLIQVIDLDIVTKKDQVEAVAAASYHAAATGMGIIVDWKAGQLKWAISAFCLGLVLLLLPILAG